MGIVLVILRMSSLEYLKDQSKSPITCVAGSTPFFLCFEEFFVYESDDTKQQAVIMMKLV